jgi:gas vesicle protein
MKKTAKLLIAGGIAAGGAMGLLLAPEKGSETRKKLRNQLNRLIYTSGCANKKEKLLMVKGRLEKHRDRLNNYIQKINSVIEKLDTGKAAG